MMVSAIFSRPKTNGGGNVLSCGHLLLVLIVGASHVVVGCAEVETPAIPPSPISASTSLSSADVPQPVSPPYSLAILPFEDYSNRPDLSWLKQGLPDMLVTDLALLRGVRVVSRHRLGEVLREQWLQHRGSFEEASSVRLGRLVGAHYLLSGLYYVGGEDLVLEVHLLDVEEGAVVRTFRVTGVTQAIPDLELDLASRLGQVFDQAALGQTAEGDSSIPENGESLAVFDPEVLGNIHQEVLPQNSLPEERAPLTSTLRTDTVLGLVRLRHVRDAAARIADDLWSQGLNIRLGALQYESIPTSASGLGAGAFIVGIPLTATLREGVLRQLDSGLTIVEGKGGAEGSEMILSYEESDAGAQQLFHEALQSPRRLFVRAIRESGEVLAVSSEWSWRLDSQIRYRANGMVSLPRSSSPLLQGIATFGGTLLTGRDSAMTFDTVIVPVPEEARTVSVEVASNQEELDVPLLSHSELAVGLQTWLLQRWFPPVAESIPTSGYLPGNRRQGVALVSGHGGTISQFQVIHIDKEEKFSQSVHEILKKLPGECFQDCVNVDSKKPLPQSFTLRVQFELTKDIRHAGLGRSFKNN